METIKHSTKFKLMKNLLVLHPDGWKQKIIEKHKMSIGWPCISLYKWQPEHSFKISAKRRALMRRKMLNEGGPIKISCQQTK